MPELSRLNIIIDKKNDVKIRELVDRGIYPSVSRAINAAAEALIELEAERTAWWAETKRRCVEAEKCPQGLLAMNDVFASIRDAVAQDKDGKPAK